MTLNKTNRDIFINILTSILGMLITTLVLLYVYRLANSKLGMEQIGLWSIVTTLTSFGNIGTFGIAGSLVKFSAELQSKGDRNIIIGLLNSCILIMSGLIAIFLLLLFLFAWLFLDQIVDVKYLSSAFSLLPYSFGIFFLTTIGYLILSVVEGLNKGYQRNIIVIISNLVFLICVSFWIEQFGIYGIFYSQLVQALVLLMLSLVMIKVNFAQYNWYTFNRDIALLRRVTKYGLKFQSVSVFQMLGEPVTKFFLSRYGGLGLVGVFEMASRVVVQIRGILVAISSNLLPKLVHIHSTQSSQKVQEVFAQVFRLNYNMFAIVFGALILFSSLIVKIWLGEENEMLVFLIQLFSIAWFVNSITIVPYIFNLGSGHLNGNVISHALIAVTNLLLGLVAILLNFETMAFVYIWPVSLVIGSIYVLSEYMKRNNLQVNQLFTKEHIMLLAAVLMHYLTILFLDNVLGVNQYLIYAIVCILYTVVVTLIIVRTESFRIVRHYFSSFNFIFSNKEA